jgi:hypothetical protein
MENPRKQTIVEIFEFSAVRICREQSEAPTVVCILSLAELEAHKRHILHYVSLNCPLPKKKTNKRRRKVRIYVRIGHKSKPILL